MIMITCDLNLGLCLYKYVTFFLKPIATKKYFVQCVPQLDFFECPQLGTRFLLRVENRKSTVEWSY